MSNVGVVMVEGNVFTGYKSWALANSSSLSVDASMIYEVGKREVAIHNDLLKLLPDVTHISCAHIPFLKQGL